MLEIFKDPKDYAEQVYYSWYIDEPQYPRVADFAQQIDDIVKQVAAIPGVGPKWLASFKRELEDFVALKLKSESEAK